VFYSYLAVFFFVIVQFKYNTHTDFMAYLLLTLHKVNAIIYINTVELHKK